MHVSYSESYDDDHQYDYANAQVNDLSSRRRANQDLQAQKNCQSRTLQTVQNPYYGVDDTEIDNSQLGSDDFSTIKVTENPYYAM